MASIERMSEQGKSQFFTLKALNRRCIYLKKITALLSSHSYDIPSIEDELAME